jgi:DivIVA domain-containing protein
MDVTPQLLKDVEFRQKVRGYDPDEVDDFLERVGLAFAQLQDRLREATDQIETANARAAQAEARVRDTSEMDDTLRRTLVLAQRTADAAVKEAEEQAAAIRSDAETTARQQLAASDERASQVLGAAEAEARRKLDAADGQARTVVASSETQAEAALSAAREQANRLLAESRQQADEVVTTARTSADELAESRRQELADEVRSLEQRRAALSRNADALEAHVSGQRTRLQRTSDDLKALLDDPERLNAPTAPELEDEPPASVAEHRTAAAAAAGTLAAPTSTPTSAPTRTPPPPQPADASDPTGVSTVEIGEAAFVAGPDASGERPAPPVAGPQGVSDPAPTQPRDLTTLERDDAAETDRSTDAVEAPQSPVVAPSSWPVGGPPPPPPPPVSAERAAGDQRPQPPAPPPPPAEDVGPGTASSVPPWLAARTPPSSSSTTAPPKPDAFYDELRRAVGDDEASDDKGEAGPSDVAAGAQPAQEARSANGEPGAAEPSKSWFGRRR